MYRKPKPGMNAPAALLVLTLCLLLCLALAAGCGGGGDVGGLEPGPVAGSGSTAGAGSAAAEPAAEAPGGALPTLALPSQLPRETSTIEPQFYADGGAYHTKVTVPHNTTLEIGTSNMIFEPDYDIASSAGLGGTAYAAYEIPTLGQSNGSEQLHLQFAQSLAHPGSLYVGLSNFARDGWDWFHPYSPDDGRILDIDLSGKSGDYDSAQGIVYVVVLFVGHGSATLENIVWGDAVVDFRLIPDPESAETELTTTLRTYLKIRGDLLDHYEFDFEGDGSWDLSPTQDPAPEHTYTGLGIRHPKARIVTQNYLSVTAQADVFVTNPGNIGPTALLVSPDSPGGPAPFTAELDGSDSFDDDTPASKIIKYEWDLDNDGVYERNTGLNSSTTVTLVKNGSNKVRLRVTDNDLATGQVSLNLNVDGGWVLEKLPGSQEEVGGGQTIGLALVGADKSPAIVYRPTGVNKVQFVKATGPAGTAWEQHRFVNVEEGDQSNPVLGMVNGKPAVAYGNYIGTGSIETLRFARALNDNGSSWSPSVTLADSNGEADLQIVDGRPAVAWSSHVGQGHGISFVHANDANGASWQAPIAFAGETSSYLSGRPVIVVGANQPPAVIAGLSESKNGTQFNHTLMFGASDLAATAFNPPVQLWANYGQRIGLLQRMDGNTEEFLFLLHAPLPNEYGLSFAKVEGFSEGVLDSADLLDDEVNDGIELALVSQAGRPLIIFRQGLYDAATNSQIFRIMVQLADDSDGSSWGPPALVFSYISGAEWNGLNAVTLQDGLPLLVFSNQVDDCLTVARWVVP